MDVKFVVTAIFLLLTLIFIYIILLPKNIEPLEIYQKLLIKRTDSPVAFTYKKIGNRYINYYVSDGQLVPQTEEYPVTFLGTKYTESKIGDVIINSDGFSISGIEKKFTCPQYYTWNLTNEQCEAENPCTGKNVGDIVGLNKYQSNEILKSDNLTHKKIYVVCTSIDPPNYDIKYCNYNEIFNGSDCVFYDVCQNLTQYTKHTTKIDDTTLNDNEYYICIDGVSQKKACTNDLVFNDKYLACMEKGACDGEPDGTTFQRNINQYIICENNAEQIVDCVQGVISVNGAYQCVNTACNTELVYYINDWVHIPIGKNTCVNNVPGTQTIPYTEKTKTFNDTVITYIDVYYNIEDGTSTPITDMTEFQSTVTVTQTEPNTQTDYEINWWTELPIMTFLVTEDTVVVGQFDESKTYLGFVTTDTLVEYTGSSADTIVPFTYNSNIIKLQFTVEYAGGITFTYDSKNVNLADTTFIPNQLRQLTVTTDSVYFVTPLHMNNTTVILYAFKLPISVFDSTRYSTIATGYDQSSLILINTVLDKFYKTNEKIARFVVTTFQSPSSFVPAVFALFNLSASFSQYMQYCIVPPINTEVTSDSTLASSRDLENQTYTTLDSATFATFFPANINYSFS